MSTSQKRDDQSSAPESGTDRREERSNSPTIREARSAGSPGESKSRPGNQKDDPRQAAEEK